MSKQQQQTKLATTWPVKRVRPEEIGLSSSRLERIDKLVRQWVDEGTVAGAVSVVYRRGGIGHLACHGYLDLETRRPMTEDTIFRIYSMTKIFTSVAVLMLLEECRLMLLDPVSRFIPEFKQFRVAVKGADGQEELVRPRREINIHDLLTHMAGFRDGTGMKPELWGLTLAQFVTEFCKIPLARQPGETWNYSVSTDILGRVVEVISGQTFDTFLAERIIKPLGMTDTAFYVPAEKRHRLATLYKTNPAGKLEPVLEPWVNGLRAQFNEPPAYLAGSWGLVSTTSDCLRLGLMLLNGGQYNGERLLSRKTVELMTADHLPAGHPTVGPYGFSFGLGVSVVRRLGELPKLGSVGEFGWGGAASTQFWIDPAEDFIPLIMLQHLPAASEGGRTTDLFKHGAYQAIID